MDSREVETLRAQVAELRRERERAEAREAAVRGIVQAIARTTAFFNDPVALPEHQLAAVRTAEVVSRRFSGLATDWRKRGYELDLGIGIATGYSTLGRIGFEGRYDYGAVGNAVILASRLADAAAPGAILLSQRTHAAVEEGVESEPVAELQLKGFSRPVTAMRLTALR